MNVEYVLFLAIPIVIIIFIVLGYIIMLNIKKKMPNSKIEKPSIKSDKKLH